jgi:hypothetical protein
VNNGNGFGVITGELTGYAQHTRRLASELHTLAGHRVSAGHGFGPVGSESGFVAALDDLGKALAHQLGAVAGDADGLGESVAKAAHTYREQDEERAKQLIELIRGRKR